MEHECICPSCLQRLQDPRELRCGDVFCGPCVSDMIAFSQLHHRELLCPACMEPSIIGAEGMSDLRVSLYHQRLMQIFRHDPRYASSSSENVHVLCQERHCCEKAAFRCLEECGFLCEGCLEFHSKRKATSNHRVESISPGLSKKDDISLSTNKCPLHDQAIIYLCKDCRPYGLYCIQCAYRDKESTPSHIHAKFSDLEEITLEEIEKLIAQGSNRYVHVKEVIEQSKKFSQQVHNKATEKISETESLFKVLQGQLKQYEESMIAMIKEEQDKIGGRLEARQYDLKILSNILQHKIKLLQEAKDSSGQQSFHIQSVIAQIQAIKAFSIPINTDATIEPKFEFELPQHVILSNDQEAINQILFLLQQGVFGSDFMANTAMMLERLRAALHQKDMYIIELEGRIRRMDTEFGHRSRDPYASMQGRRRGGGDADPRLSHSRTMDFEPSFPDMRVVGPFTPDQGLMSTDQPLGSGVFSLEISRGQSLRARLSSPASTMISAPGPIANMNPRTHLVPGSGSVSGNGNQQTESVDGEIQTPSQRAEEGDAVHELSRLNSEGVISSQTASMVVQEDGTEVGTSVVETTATAAYATYATYASYTANGIYQSAASNSCAPHATPIHGLHSKSTHHRSASASPYVDLSVTGYGAANWDTYGGLKANASGDLTRDGHLDGSMHPNMGRDDLTSSALFVQAAGSMGSLTSAQIHLVGGAMAVSPAMHGRDIQEVASVPVTADTARAGLRVRRGRDWRTGHGNQDGGPGKTGVLVRPTDAERDIWIVKWDHTGLEYNYSTGYGGKFHLEFA